jgi:hypothetical protein
MHLKHYTSQCGKLISAALAQTGVAASASVTWLVWLMIKGVSMGCLKIIESGKV